MTLARLSSELALPKSSVHGLCTTLVSFGYLRRQADGSFLIGPGVMGLAEAFVEIGHAHTLPVAAARRKRESGSGPLSVQHAHRGRHAAAAVHLLDQLLQPREGDVLRHGAVGDPGDLELLEAGQRRVGTRGDGHEIVSVTVGGVTEEYGATGAGVRSIFVDGLGGLR